MWQDLYDLCGLVSIVSLVMFFATSFNITMAGCHWMPRDATCGGVEEVGDHSRLIFGSEERNTFGAPAMPMLL